MLEQTAASVSPIMMAPNGTRFGGWNVQTGDNRFGTGNLGFEFMVVHFKALVPVTAALTSFMDVQHKEMEQPAMRTAWTTPMPVSMWCTPIRSASTSATRSPP